MKRLAAAVLFLSLFGCGDNEDSSRRLVLFHTNDEHSHLFGFAPEIDDYPFPGEPGDGDIVGGIARRAVILQAERDALGGSTDSVTVSAGDETQGALPQIAFASESPDFTLMNQLGYAVMCPGNHEFDLGPAAFAASIAAGQSAGGIPQIVSTNIRFSDEDQADDDLAALYGEPGSGAAIVPYHVLETESGIRVGFVGIMGINASFVAPLKGPVLFSADPDEEGNQSAALPDLYGDIQPAVDALRNVEQVDVVVAVSHSGVNTGDPTLGDDYRIGQNVSGLDIIVSGHSHTPLAEPQFADAPDGYRVPIVQAGSYGRFLGRAELVLDGDRPSLDMDGTRLIDIDDSTVATDTAVTVRLDQLITSLEADALGEQLSIIEGVEITDDSGEVGDLYFRPLGQTSFDIDGSTPSAETNMLNLSTDAMLATAEQLIGPTLMAVQASGSVRDDIKAGKTGVLSFADLYRVLPLGVNPLDGSIGYPLVHFYINTVELKAALEIGVSRGYIDDSLFLAVSGLHVEYDTSRDPQSLTNQARALEPDNGRVTKISVDVDHSDGVDNPTVDLFDLARGNAAWNSDLGGAFTLHPVVTSLYIASFADTAGVTLKDENGDAVALTDAIMRRPDTTVVRDYEAFMTYIKTLSDDTGGLPARYDAESSEGAVPRRLLCSGPLCN